MFQEVATFLPLISLRNIYSVEGEQASKGFRNLQTTKMTKNWIKYKKMEIQSLSAHNLASVKHLKVLQR